MLVRLVRRFSLHAFAASAVGIAVAKKGRASGMSFVSRPLDAEDFDICDPYHLGLLSRRFLSRAVLGVDNVVRFDDHIGHSFPDHTNSVGKHGLPHLLKVPVSSPGVITRGGARHSA